MTRLPELVGNTPLLALTRLSVQNGGAEVWAKAEFLNPSGSVKDRAALAMMRDGVSSGRLTKEKVLIDATSGNTGIAYAMFGAALGYRVRLYLPANTGIERKRVIGSFGAELVETNPLEGSDGALLAVRTEVARAPQLYFYPDQYANPANPRAHYEGTGAEVYWQTEGRVTHFICGMGTSGTFVGTSRRLKEENRAIRTIAVQPDSPLHGIEGTKHMASTITPGIYDDTDMDEVLTVGTEEAYGMARRLAAEEGLFVGISSGANVAAALRLAKTLPPDALVVTLLCDGGSRYLTEGFWEQGQQAGPANTEGGGI
ncbi:MAG: cysteine synthase family protein [Clostridiales Family XIII bacterium]|jgi:cysteine synthase B|nr:cysteine synthase family protein [Clostridiales Family XIII bacterium]